MTGKSNGTGAAHDATAVTADGPPPADDVEAAMHQLFALAVQVDDANATALRLPDKVERCEQHLADARAALVAAVEAAEAAQAAYEAFCSANPEAVARVESYKSDRIAAVEAELARLKGN